ncbi:MAG: biotin-dependent carboxyltransferase family protein [Bacteroidota bacterium]
MLTLLKAGIYTTVQDQGRFMGAHLGIPISGAMDRKSADFVNLILGNDRNDAMLECTYTGPTIKFHTPTLIAIVGAQIPAFLNKHPLDTSRAIRIHSNDVLTFGKMEKGSRFYIGVKNGIQSQSIYQSRSTCTTAGILYQLKNGDQLSYQSYSNAQNSSVSIRRPLGNNKIAANKGPEFEILSASSQKTIQKESFSILPSSNRMAFRIHHNLQLAHAISILSSGTLPGTVQLTPSGELIILMRDTQTTGGYPRILQLTEESINDLAQLKVGEYFNLVLSD